MYEKITLPNGVRVVFEKMPYVRSAAVGIWIDVGSRYETASENGSAHFIEHMLFKGTNKKSAADLAGIMDGIGGQINAFTTRDSTCFYARVLDSHLDTAIELLSEMFFESKFAQTDVESERGVILEEIDMYEDSPEDLAMERLFTKCFKGALGRPILGKPSTLKNMTGELLKEFMGNHYKANRVVVSLCGSFDDSHLKKIQDIFGRMEKSRKAARKKGNYTPAFVLKKKPTEQNHLCIGFPGLRYKSEDRFAMQIMSSILGGGMSSRLFQTVRENNGLCYSIFTFPACFSDTGFFGIGTALGRDTEKKALGLIREELCRMRDEPVTDDELSRAREQAKSSLVMTLESTSSRMNRLGIGELHLGTVMSPEEVIDRYDAVTKRDVRRVAGSIIDFDMLSFSAVGRVVPVEEYEEALNR